MLLTVSGLPRRLIAEGLGTGVLVAAVVGSGIMATRLTDDVAVRLLFNAVATVAALGVLIAVLGPVSGGHFNPAVTLVELARRVIAGGEAAGYIVSQLAGAMLGTALADLMFGLPAWQVSTQERSGPGLVLGEVVATAGLLLVVGSLTASGHGRLGPLLVPAWIGAAYLFTSSTSFANPAVTVARSLTNTFAGIAPVDVGPFVVAQLVGAGLGAGLCLALYPRSARTALLDLPEAIHDRS